MCRNAASRWRDSLAVSLMSPQLPVRQSRVTCHVSRVTCHVSRVTWPLARVISADNLVSVLTSVVGNHSCVVFMVSYKLPIVLLIESAINILQNVYNHF